MNRIFAITTASDRVSTGGDGRGEITFTVTNSSPRNLRGQLRVRPLGSTREEWLNVAGETERAFTPYATQQVVVKVATPLGAPAGKYQFRLDAVSSINPDDFTEGPTVDMEVEATEAPKKGFPWWIVAVAAGVVILIGAGAWWLWPSGGTKVVFEDNFEEAPKGAWSQTKTETSPNGKAKFLGQFGTDTVKLALNDLPPHKTVTVNFDLYINNAWLGDAPERGGKDEWGLKLDDGEILIQTTFSNVTGCSDSQPNCKMTRQAYACKNGEDTSNGCYSRGDDATFGAAAVNSLGYNAFPFLNSRDSVYKIKHTFSHDKSQLILNFFSKLSDGRSNFQGVDKRGWGLDNVRIEAHSEELSEILAKGADGTKVVFEDNFDEAPKGAWSQTKTETTPNGKTKFLGQFESDTVKLTLKDLPPHKIARIDFDLFIINTWEGLDLSDGNGPDLLTIYHGEEEPGKQPNSPNARSAINDMIFGSNSTVLLFAAFSNLDDRKQSFTCEKGAYAAPFCYFGREERATYGAAEVASLGFKKAGCYRCTDSVYKIKRVFAHDKSQLTLNFVGQLRERIKEAGNEGWGLDNVRIEVQ
jgi:hypothetical protein